jgi:2-polyprenyl-3-methyl-5-hydroxy-6-metoxy-1,4-benzoquinol methylase
MAESDHVEQAADWDGLWEGLPEDDDPDGELDTIRWRVQEQHVLERFGSFEGLQIVEIGAGRASNALMYARRGARATVLDYSPLALEQSAARFAAQGLEAEYVLADAFALPAELVGRFDVSMSFGLAEHFLHERRQGIITAHLDLVRPGGLAFINVPNKYSPFYRAWMAWAKRRGTWTLGTEVPFSAREMVALARGAGGTPLKPVHCGGLGTLVNQGPNAVLNRLGRRPLPVSQRQIPVLDYLAYDLMVPVAK